MNTPVVNTNQELQEEPSLHIVDNDIIEEDGKGGPLSFDQSYTSFEDQIRIARARERRRQQSVKLGQKEQGTSVKDRMKALQTSFSKMPVSEITCEPKKQEQEPQDDLEDSLDLSHVGHHSSTAPYTHDDSHTSFEDQLRIAREREAKRVANLSTGASKSKFSSLKDRLEQQSKIKDEAKPAVVSKWSKKMTRDSSDQKTSDFGSNEQRSQSPSKDNKADDTTEEEVTEESMDLSHVGRHASAAPYTHDDSHTSFEDQMRIAREREAKRKANLAGGAKFGSLKDRMERFNSSLPTLSSNKPRLAKPSTTPSWMKKKIDENKESSDDKKVEPQEEESETQASLDVAAVAELSSTKTEAPLSFHQSYTSFDDQLRIARERERRRRQQEAKSGNASVSSIKDRMKAFQK